MKYKEWLNIWLENYIKPTTKLRTYKRYLQIVKLHILNKLGEDELGDIVPLKLQQFVTELLQSGNLLTKKGLSANSVNVIINVLQRSLKLANILGETKEYVGSYIKSPKPKEKVITCFTLKEQKKIEQAVLSDRRDKMFGVVLCLYSGLRVGELLALRWADVDLKKGTITIKRACHDGNDVNGKTCRIEDTPKTASSRRTIPLPNQFLQLLKKYKLHSKSEYIISNDGKPIYVRSYQRSFDLLLKS